MRILAALFLMIALSVSASGAERPNVLWISCEDIGPHLGCYGCADAKTPTLDTLAARGVRFSHAFTTCPVCATNRSSIITGMYPTTLGTHEMRCQAVLPDDVKCFSEYLREAGYYCGNNAKTDYNFRVPKGTWDESSDKAHWRNRTAGQPFFFVRNFTNTHESHIWPRGQKHLRQTPDLTAAERLDPANLQLPPYYPDVPEARRDWANYLENITQLDHNVARLLNELEKDGLVDDTIIFFWSDHGAGLPRAKRWLYDSGTRVPLFVVIPEKFRVEQQAQANTVDDQLVSFIDLAPTVLTLCGIGPPKQMQGRAFLGPRLSPPRKHAFGTRDRMDERTDMIRTVRDKRYRYIRNFMPWRPYAQWIDYAARNATMQVLRRLKAAGQLDAAQQWFMADRKPAEELYDTETDPHEIHNLAIQPSQENKARLQQFRDLLEAWQLETRDLGLLPETLVAEGEKKFGNRRDILNSAEGRARIAALQRLLRQSQVEGKELPLDLDAKDVALRWWSVTTQTAPYLPRRGRPNETQAADPRDAQQTLLARLRPGFTNDAVIVRIAVAEALGKLDDPAPAIAVLVSACGDKDPWIRLAAVTALDELGDRAAAAQPAINERLSDSEPYVARVAQRAIERWKAFNQPRKGDRK